MAESIIKNDKSYVNQYYDLMGKKAIKEERLLPAVLASIKVPKSNVVITSRLIARIILKIRGIDRPNPAYIEKRALQFFAFLDAVSILRKRGVPVLFYQRINEECANARYTESEKKRMKKGKSFVQMIADIEKNEADLKEIFREHYSREYVKLLSNIPQVVQVDNVYRHEDIKSKYVNVINGKRFVVGQPEHYEKTVHVYGRCGVFGYAVEDGENLPSYLQEILLEKGIDDIRVINHGLWGGDDTIINHNFLLEAERIKTGDIVVFYRSKPEAHLLRKMIESGMYYQDFSEEWHKNRNNTVTFFDQPGHMNAAGYRLLARFVADDLAKSVVFAQKPREASDAIITGALNEYQKQQSSSELAKGIKKYIDEILHKIPNKVPMKENGAIVMNCNPFTYGHRYLIEYAARQVDYLFIFVVEEDKSRFAFSDRFKMVNDATSDIENVIVVPSGNFIISAFTFPEYFMKDYVKNKNFDVSLDVELFCKYIAPPLGIKKRFVGQEPFDPVTNNYNKSMSEMLPQYGITFVEISRMAINDGDVISATTVRKYLDEGNLELLKKYVPDTTYRILESKYNVRESDYGE